jgi:PiT family inorganic phosphate transporter
MASRMAMAWLFTLPVAAVVGGLSGKLASSGNAGVLALAALAVVVIGGIWAYSRRNVVDASNVTDVPVPASTSTSTPVPAVAVGV